MYSGEEKDRETDIKSFSAIVLYNLPILVFSVLLSIFFSANTIRNSTPIYLSEAIIALPSDSNREVSAQGFDELASVGSSLGLFSKNSSSNSLLPRILGRQFLTILIEKQDLIEHLKGNEGCGDKNPQIFSLTGLLVALNLYEFQVANQRQIKDSFADCLKEMITVKNFEVNKIKTSAYAVEVRDRDSLMAQKIANAIIDEYFIQELAQKKQSYENTLTYFSDILAKTQIDVDREKQKMNQFLLSNFEFVASSASSLSTDRRPSTDPRQLLDSFSSQLILEVNELKKQGKRLVGTADVLSRIYKSDDYKLNNLTSAQKKDLYVNVSREAAETLEKTVDSSMITDLQKLKLKSTLKNELERLRLLNSAVENLVTKKNEELKKVLENSKEFGNIELNYLRKLTYFKQLERSIDKSSVEAGVLEISEPVIYTRATQSMIPIEPNIKSLFLRNAIIFLVIGFLVVLIKHIFMPRIYHVKQLDYFNENGATITLSNRKELNPEKLSSGDISYKNFNIDFFNKIKEKGSIGCIIDIENKNDASMPYSDKLSMYLANFFTNSNEKSLCCVKDTAFPPISLSKKLARFYHFSSNEDVEPDSGKIALAAFQATTSNANLNMLQNEFKKFDKVLISAGEDCSIAMKFDLIERCDFFILVGKIGISKLDQFESFFGKSEVLREKYVGCIMVKK